MYENLHDSSGPTPLKTYKTLQHTWLALATVPFLLQNLPSPPHKTKRVTSQSTGRNSLASQVCATNMIPRNTFATHALVGARPIPTRRGLKSLGAPGTYMCQGYWKHCASTKLKIFFGIRLQQ